FLGLHFFNPAPILPLVELVQGPATSEANLAKAEAFLVTLDKKPVRVRDAPGFVVNRLLLPMINEAAGLVEDGVADAQAVDAAMTLGAAHPMGPLALADLIGIDVVCDILSNFAEELQQERFKPRAILQAMREAGILGRK